MSLPAKSYDFVFHPHINRLFQQRIEPIKQIRLFEINERRRSPNQTNLANTCSMFMSVDLLSFAERLRSLSCLLYTLHLLNLLLNNIALQ
ncbi:hypothetical protein HMPREF2140_02165 [Hoylesella buccalis DNF00985]|nr:hypothetical protein HMPREF2140_02165 [Hoylesella buccalis DNF00985]